MKKALAGLAIAMALITTTVPVYASSTTTNTDTSATTTATTAETEALAAGVTATTSDGVAATVTAVPAATATSATAAAQTLVAAGATVAKVVDITLPAGTVIPAGGIVITIAVPSFDPSKQDIAVLHQKADGTWETRPVVGTAAGSVSANFDSLSPVAFVLTAKTTSAEDHDALLKAAQIAELKAKAAAAQNTQQTGTVTSPKTGESMPVLPFAAIACLAGAAVLVKKYRAA